MRNRCVLLPRPDAAPPGLGSGSALYALFVWAGVRLCQLQLLSGDFIPPVPRISSCGTP